MTIAGLVSVFVAERALTNPVSVILTPAHRDAILEEIEFAFESAGDLPFMLEHGGENKCDRDDARELIARLRVAVELLDQLGWQRTGNRDGYVLEVDEGVDWFASRIESFALAGLEFNRQGCSAGADGVRTTTRRLIDADLEKLSAARLVRAAVKVARDADASGTQQSDATAEVAVS